MVLANKFTPKSWYLYLLISTTVFHFWFTKDTVCNADINCPPPWYKPPHSKFEICVFINSDSFVNWHVSRKNCKSKGADLIIIEDSEMDTIVREEARKATDAPYWIGLYTPDKSTEFQWLDTGEKPDYNNWISDPLSAVENTSQALCGMIGSGRRQWFVGFCNKTNGFSLCETGRACKTNHYGLKCDKLCSPNCKPVEGSVSNCEWTNGKCKDGCIPGFTGLRCDKVASESDRTAGASYGGDTTAGTKVETNKTSSGKCSKHCAGKGMPCDRVTKACLNGCVAGYQGMLCDKECNKGTFGDQCAQKCSTGCKGDDHPCSPVNGTCVLGCLAEYTGDLCERTATNAKSAESGSSTVIVVISFFFLLFLIGAALLYKLGTAKKKNEEEENGKKEEPEPDTKEMPSDPQDLKPENVKH